MQLHEITRSTNNKRKYGRQVGRGGTRGKTSGRGTKGQNARAGRKFRPAMRDAIKKLPKLRGYAFSSAHEKSVAVNLSDLEVKFNAGETVNKSSLVEKKIIEKVMAKIPKIKILGTGEITKALTVEGLTVSVTAKAKIEKAGGSVIL
jgi:large subunit ribosomal protein L15